MAGAEIWGEKNVESLVDIWLAGLIFSHSSFLITIMPPFQTKVIKNKANKGNVE